MVGCAQLVVDDADSSLPAGGGRVPGSTGFLTGPQGDGAHAYDLQSLIVGRWGPGPPRVAR